MTSIRRQYTRNLVLHVPHSSHLVPPEARRAILLNDAELRSELLRMTDAYTDERFSDRKENERGQRMHPHQWSCRSDLQSLVRANTPRAQTPSSSEQGLAEFFQSRLLVCRRDSWAVVSS